MDVEFKDSKTNLEVIDYVIRDVEWENSSDGSGNRPHLQLRAKLLDREVDDYDCDITYFDKSGKFVGIDEDCFDLTCKKDKDITLFSICLNLPTDAEKMVIEFTPNKASERGFVEYCVGAFMVFTLLIMGSWAFKGIASMFS